MTAHEQPAAGVALKPCPFCGGPNHHRFNNPDEFKRPSHGIQCANGNCWICGPECETEAEAVTAWNTRAPTDAGGAVSEADIEAVLPQSIFRQIRGDSQRIERENYGIAGFEAAAARLARKFKAALTPAPQAEGEAVDQRFPKGRPEHGCYCTTYCAAPRIMGRQTPCLRRPIVLTPGQKIEEGEVG